MLLVSLLAGMLLQATGSSTIIRDGYTDQLSAFPKDSIMLFLNASERNPRFPLKLYDLNGKIVYRATLPVSPQGAILPKAYESGYSYARSAKIAVPELASGIYLWENKIPFVIKNRHARIVVVYPSNTECAYNNAGGKSLYGFNSSDRIGATKVSFLRPRTIETFSESFLKWLAREGHQGLGYITDMDLDNYSEVKKAKLLIVPGHSEYWTLKARKNFDRFVLNGNDALVLSGNTMWWQVRYSKEGDQLICYRKSVDDSVSSQKLKTINWNDPTLDYPILRSLGTDFSIGGYGQKVDKGWDGYKLISNSPLLAGTGLKIGDILPLKSQEVDGAPIVEYKDGTPVLNDALLGFFRAEIVGFDRVSRSGAEGIMTWLIFTPTKSSGTVINVASTDWCSHHGIGSNSQIQKITRNMIRKLLNKESVFSGEDAGELKITNPDKI